MASAAARASSTSRTSCHGAAHSPDLPDEAALGEPVASRPEGREPGAERRNLPRRGGRVQPDVLQLVGDHVRHQRQPPGRVRIVVGADDDLVRDRRGRARRVGIQGDDPVAHRAGRDAEHPSELPATQDPDRGARRERRRRVGRRQADSEAVERVLDEVALVDRVQEVRVAVRRQFDELALRRRIPVTQGGVRAQRVAKGEELDQLVAGRRHDVEVDAIRAAVVVDVAEHQRAGRRKRREAALPLKPERHQRIDDVRDVVGCRLDPEVDHVLARHPRHRRAADVLGVRARPCGLDQPRDVARHVRRLRVPRVEGRRQLLVGADREVGHRP